MPNIFGSETPVDQDVGGDTSDITLGVKWRADVDGFVTAIRVYVGAGDPATGAIYTSGGSLLGSVALSGLSGLGWSTVNFASPIAITANTVYVAAVYWPGGNYPITSFGLDGTTINGHLEALDDAESSNGIYNYATGLSFPSSSFQATNYFADVEFSPVTARVTGGGIAALTQPDMRQVSGGGIAVLAQPDMRQITGGGIAVLVLEGGGGGPVVGGSSNNRMGIGLHRMGV